LPLSGALGFQGVQLKYHFGISKWKLLIGFIICIAGISFGVSTLLRPYTELLNATDKFHPIVIYIVCCLLVFLLALVLSSIVSILLNSNAGLSLTEEGIIDSSSIFSIGLIPQEHIGMVSTTYVNKKPMINLFLKSNDWLKSRGSKGKLLFYLLKYTSGYSIPSMPFKEEHSIIFEAVKAHVKKA